MALLPRVGGPLGARPLRGRARRLSAPRTEDEIDLLRYLRERYGRVSSERVVSGPGLFNIYNFLRDVRKMTETPRVREALGRGEDPAKVIGEAAASARTAASSARGRWRCSSPPMAHWRGTWRCWARRPAASTWAAASRPRSCRGSPTAPFSQAFTAKGRFVPYLERHARAGDPERPAALLGAARHAALCRLADFRRAVLARRVSLRHARGCVWRKLERRNAAETFTEVKLR